MCGSRADKTSVLERVEATMRGFRFPATASDWMSTSRHDRAQPPHAGDVAGRPLRGDNSVMAEHYQRPDWFTAHVFNPAVATLTRLGLSVAGSRVLEVRGRKTGQPRRTPVNLLIVDGNRYLVAPRGQTQWVRNLRAQGEGRLLVGRRTERFSATEIADADKPALLRAYLKRSNWEVGTFFDGVGPESPDDELRRIAPDHPVFRISEPAA